MSQHGSSRSPISSHRAPYNSTIPTENGTNSKPKKHLWLRFSRWKNGLRRIAAKLGVRVWKRARLLKLNLSNATGSSDRTLQNQESIAVAPVQEQLEPETTAGTLALSSILAKQPLLWSLLTDENTGEAFCHPRELTEDTSKRDEPFMSTGAILSYLEQLSPERLRFIGKCLEILRKRLGLTLAICFISDAIDSESKPGGITVGFTPPAKTSKHLDFLISPNFDEDSLLGSASLRLRIGLDDGYSPMCPQDLLSSLIRLELSHIRNIRNLSRYVRSSSPNSNSREDSILLHLQCSIGSKNAVIAFVPPDAQRHTNYREYLVVHQRSDSKAEDVFRFKMGLFMDRDSDATITPAKEIASRLDKLLASPQTKDFSIHHLSPKDRKISIQHLDFYSDEAQTHATLGFESQPLATANSNDTVFIRYPNSELERQIHIPSRGEDMYCEEIVETLLGVENDERVKMLEVIKRYQTSAGGYPQNLYYLRCLSESGAFIARFKPSFQFPSINKYSSKTSRLFTFLPYSRSMETMVLYLNATLPAPASWRSIRNLSEEIRTWPKDALRSLIRHTAERRYFLKEDLIVNSAMYSKITGQFDEAGTGKHITGYYLSAVELGE